MHENDETSKAQEASVVLQFPIHMRGVALVLDSTFAGHIRRNGALELEGVRYDYVGPEFADGPDMANLAVVVEDVSIAEAIKRSNKITFL